MKKLVILGTALLALNAVASEVQVKGGYDFNRNYRHGQVGAGLDDWKLTKGPTAGLEYIFDNQGEFEWGVGAEHKFSNNSGKLKEKDKTTGVEEKFLRSTPVYALGKFNVVTTKDGNDALYVLGRAGYNFAKEVKGGAEDISGGLYVAAGIGTEFGPVSLEALYERAGVKFDYQNGKIDRDNIDTFGLRAGYRFGQLKNDRSPKIVTVTQPTIVEKIVEVEKPVYVKEPTREIENAKTAILPFSCAADERKCVIRGFKVDGRVPSENEAKDLGAIANVINQFAQGGTIDFVGHTDSTGSDAYNQKLSVARAQNVARLLKEYGLSNNVGYGTITGLGESQPMDTNDTVEGRYNNRRVELFFQNVDFSNVKFITR